MPAWNNKDLVVYHGTDTLALGGYGALAIGNSLTFRVNLALCRQFTDFGQGFYTTTSLHQAKQWANARVRRMLSARGPAQSAVVVRFTVNRDWLAGLHALAFVRGIQDFWDLVQDCRNGFPPHQRGNPQPAYDVVYGPVTLWPQLLLIQDCDQISFHTQNAVNGLPFSEVEDYAPAPGGLF
jgi:hypothetical protein